MTKVKRLLAGLLCVILLMTLCTVSLADKKKEEKRDYYEISFYARKGGRRLYVWNTDKDGYLTEDLKSCGRSGLVFMGWFTDPYEGRRVTNKTRFKKDTNVWAHWAYVEGRHKEPPKPGVYTVTFAEDDNGRTVPFTLQTGEDGKLPEVPKPAVEKKRNLQFLCWRNRKTKELVTEETVFTGNAELQAVWGSSVKADLTFMSDNCVLANREYVPGTWVTSLQPKPEENTSKKRTFLGWFREPEGGEAVTALRVTEDTVLYAQWSEPGWTVNFTDAFAMNEDGTLIDGNRLKTKPDGALEFIPEGVSRGCRFLGWYTDKKLTQPLTADTVFKRDIRVWAKTEKVPGVRVTLDPVKYGCFRSSVKPEVILAQADGTIGPLPQASWFSNGLERREFLGWFDEQDRPVTAETVFTENTTIYARWKEGTRISFASNAKPAFRAAYTDEEGKLAELPAIRQLQRKNPPLGWYTKDGQKVTGDTVFTEETELTARWGATVTCFTERTGNWGSGKVADLVTNEDGTLPYLPAVEHPRGYPFTGWVDADGNPVTAETVFTADAKVFGSWETGGKKINFLGTKGGVPDVKSIMTKNDGTVEQMPLAHHKNGFPFAGWSTTEDGSTPVADGTVFTADNTVLYAAWTPIYKVSFRAHDGNVDRGIKAVMTDESGHISEWPGATHPLKLPFDGWYISPRIRAEEDTVFTKDSWLDAHWGTPEVPAGGFTVSLEDRGEVTEKLTSDTGKLKELPVPTRSGATFYGWYTGEAATGLKVRNGTLIGGDMTFHAAWLLPLTPEEDANY